MSIVKRANLNGCHHTNHYGTDQTHRRVNCLSSISIHTQFPVVIAKAHEKKKYMYMYKKKQCGAIPVAPPGSEIYPKCTSL